MADQEIFAVEFDPRESGQRSPLRVELTEDSPDRTYEIFLPDPLGKIPAIQNTQFRTRDPRYLQRLLNSIEPRVLAKHLILLQHNAAKRAAETTLQFEEVRILEDAMAPNPKAFDPLRDHIYEINKATEWESPICMTQYLYDAIKFDPQKPTQKTTWKAGFDNAAFAHDVRTYGTARISYYNVIATVEAKRNWYTFALLFQMKAADTAIRGELDRQPTKEELHEAEKTLHDPEGDEEQELFCHSYRDEIRAFAQEHHKFLVDSILNNHLNNDHKEPISDLVRVELVLGARDWCTAQKVVLPPIESLPSDLKDDPINPPTIPTLTERVNEIVSDMTNRNPDDVVTVREVFTEGEIKQVEAAFQEALEEQPKSEEKSDEKTKKQKKKKKPKKKKANQGEKVGDVTEVGVGAGMEGQPPDDDNAGGEASARVPVKAQTEENFPLLTSSSPAAAPRPQPQQVAKRAKVLVAMPKVLRFADPLVTAPRRGASEEKEKMEKEEAASVPAASDRLAGSTAAPVTLSASAVEGSSSAAPAAEGIFASSLVWNDRETYPGLYPAYGRYVSVSATSASDSEEDVESVVAASAVAEVVGAGNAPLDGHQTGVLRVRALSSPAALSSGNTNTESGRVGATSFRFLCHFCGEATFESVGGAVVCPGCGPNKKIRYCSDACLLADSYDHSLECASPFFEELSIDLLRPVLPGLRTTTGQCSPELYRQKQYHMIARDVGCGGPYKAFLAARATPRRQQELAGHDNWEPNATLEPADYFLFHPLAGIQPWAIGRIQDFAVFRFNFPSARFTPTSASSSGAPTTIISEQQTFRRALCALFVTSHTSIAEFVFRMLTDYINKLPGDRYDGQVKSDLCHLLTDQFKFECNFAAENGRRSSTKRFKLVKEWKEIEGLVGRLENKNPILGMWGVGGASE